MTPTNTQGSEQDAKAIVKVLKYYPGITSHMDLTVKSPLVVELAALIKSDREEHTKKIEAIIEHEYQHTTYSDMNLDSICNYDDAFEHGAEVLNKKISKRLTHLSKEDK